MTSWRLEDSDEDVGVRNEAAISAPAPAPAPPSSHTNAGRPAASALTDRYSLWEYVCMFVWTRCCVLYRVTCALISPSAGWALPPPVTMVSGL